MNRIKFIIPLILVFASVAAHAGRAGGYRCTVKNAKGQEFALTFITKDVDTGQGALSFEQPGKDNIVSIDAEMNWSGSMFITGAKDIGINVQGPGNGWPALVVNSLDNKELVRFSLDNCKLTL